MSEEKRKGNLEKQHRKTIALLLVAAALVLLIIAVLSMWKPGGEDDRIYVMLDAGHGGSGIQGYVDEDAFNQQVVDKLEEKIESDSAFKVALSHDSGTEMSVADRAAVINEQAPDIVLSIHCASDPDSSKSGTRIFADPPSSRYNAESVKLADAIKTQLESEGDSCISGYFYYQPIKDGSVFQEHIVTTDDTTDYGQETFDLMQQTNAPVVRVEWMYATNKDDCQKWNSEEGIDKAAELCFNALKASYAE